LSVDNYSIMKCRTFYFEKIFTENGLIQKLEMCIRQEYVTKENAYEILAEILSAVNFISNTESDIFKFAHYYDDLITTDEILYKEIDFNFVHKDVSVPYVQIIDAQTQTILYDQLVYEEDVHDVLDIMIQDIQIHPHNKKIFAFYCENLVPIIKRPILN